MSVTSELSRVQVTLTGPADAVPIGFYFLNDADIVGFSTIDGVDTLLVLNTDYTLAGAGAPAGGMAAMIGGEAGEVITFARADALTQEEEFLYMGQLTPSAIERGYDRLCMQVQRLFLMVKRSIRLPLTAAEGGELGDVATRAGTTFEFDEDGNLVLVKSAGTSATAAAASAVAAAESAESAALNEAAAAAFAGAAYTTATGGTPNALDSAVTAGGVTPTRSIRYVQTGSVGGGDLAIQTWSLQAGTNAEDGVSYVRPDDYNAGTNAKVWVRVG